jgi:fructokinase
VWDHCAYYIAQLCVTLVLIASPELICIGGGVLNRASLYPRIRTYVLSLLRGYIQHLSLTEQNIDTFIRPSHWGSRAGLVGAVYLAKLAAEEQLKENKL